MLSTTLVFLSLLVGTTLATPVETSAVAEPSVLTAQGWHPASNVHAVPAGGSIRVVNNEIHLLNPSGAVVHSATATNDTTGVTPLIGDSIAYTIWNSTASLSSFNASWAVPSNPESSTGQTLFYCHAMYSPQTGSPKHALEAVLQYGPSEAGGDENSWSTAIWYRVGSHIYHTSAVATTPGEKLEGSIRFDSDVNDLFSYTASFADKGKMTISTGLEFLGLIDSLAVHNIQSTSNFPTDDTVFYDINVGLVADPSPSVNWTAVSDPAEKVTTVVDVQGATDAKVAMSYST